MRGGPAAQLEHGERSMNEVGGGRGLGDGGERDAERFGLRTEAAEPELAALIGRFWWKRGL